MEFLRRRGVFLIFLSVLCIPAAAQTGDELLEKFNQNLMVNILGLFRTGGVEITPELRAKAIAYQYDRLSRLTGEFESERQKMNSLKHALKDFVMQAGGQSAWTIVENGLSGAYTAEIEKLLGGTAAVPPIFDRLDDLVRKRKSLDYTEGVIYQRGINEDVIIAAQGFLLALKDRQFRKAGESLAGRFAEEWEQVQEQMETDAGFREEMYAFAENLEWKLWSDGFADTNPPMIKLVWGLMAVDKWVNYEMHMILDAGSWKIVSFDEE